MKDENWLDMVKKQGELRHFGSLAIRKTQKGNQISAQEIDFLFRVAFAKELMTPGQLAMAMGVSKTIISRLTEQLERKKFISKERDEKQSLTCAAAHVNAGILCHIHSFYSLHSLILYGIMDFNNKF